MSEDMSAEARAEIPTAAKATIRSLSGRMILEPAEDTHPLWPGVQCLKEAWVAELPWAPDLTPFQAWAAVMRDETKFRHPYWVAMERLIDVWEKETGNEVYWRVIQ